MTLIYGCSKDVRSWVSNQIFGHPDNWDDKVEAIGVVKDGQLIAGVVYSDYHPNLSIEMSVASIDKTWATRHNLRAFFSYPFIQLGLKRVQTLCSALEGDTIVFNKRLGFQQEGSHREAWPLGGDAVSFGMLKHECRWLNGR